MLRPITWLILAFALVSLAACKGDPATPEYWEKQVTGAKKIKERNRILEDLRESKRVTPAFLPMMHKLLGSEKQAEVKATIARMLGEAKDASSVQPLVDALDLGTTDTASNAMNKEITTALGEIGDPKATPTLLRLLKVKDNYTKIEAINALGDLRAPEAVAPLMEIATDETGEPFISKKAIQALGMIGDAKSVPALLKMMFKERRGTSFYVESSFALYQIGQPAADAALPLLKGEDKALTAWAKENGIIEAALWAKSAQVLGDLHEARAEKPLLDRLKFESEFLDVKLFVRMRAADALGRMRSKEAVKLLSTMLDEEEASARQIYVRALTSIGGRDAIPALLKSAAQGSWDAREPAIISAAMLGDDREIAAFEKFVKDEEGLTTAECKDNPDYAGCNAPAELVKKHAGAIVGHQKRLEAAKACKTEGACWAKKLDDADTGVRERAAYEVGRSGKAELIG
ncbi:MAG: HEAT repeat domain-containing protein, partial [Myxococcaceae bacterium]